MKILLMDGHTLFQDDIPWSPLTSFGEVVFHERTNQDQPLRSDADTDILITNKALVGVRELDHYKSLKLVIVSATGYNCVDVKACAERGIPVCNVPAYGTYSVAQHTMAMMLEYSNHITLHNASVQRGEWSSCPDFSYTVSPIFEWHGKTMGIVGMGTIGSRVGNMAASMGMHVIYHHRRDLKLSDRYLVSLEKLAESSDVISLHCPLNASTEKMVNAEFLSAMKKTAILINTSRGGLIDTAALRKALEEKQIAAALLDVLEKEPPPPDHPLIGLPNAIITPHIAWISFEARQRIFEIIKTTISSFETGQLINRVN